MYMIKRLTLGEVSAGIVSSKMCIRDRLAHKACGVGRDDILTALQVIRRGVLRFWKRSVAVSFYEWWKREL